MNLHPTIAALALLASALPAAAATPSIITGLVQVVDGDTLMVGSVSVRLKGVDAMELDTPEGNTAKTAMLKIVSNGETVMCILTGEKTHDREVGYCKKAGGVDINRAIVASGAALACPRFEPVYLEAEKADARQRLQQASYCVKTHAARVEPKRREDCEAILPGGCDVRPSMRVVPEVDKPRGNGGCGSRGGPGYRLPNGKCASWRD
jgi:endonuclease YncB( thermonuclease family)